MKTKKIFIYKISEGDMSLEKSGTISITKIDEEEDSLELKGLGSLISDLEPDEYIGILISDDTDTPKSSNYEDFKTKVTELGKDERKMSRANIKEMREKMGTVKTNLQKAEKLRFR